MIHLKLGISVCYGILALSLFRSLSQKMKTIGKDYLCTDRMTFLLNQLRALPHTNHADNKFSTVAYTSAGSPVSKFPSVNPSSAHIRC